MSYDDKTSRFIYRRTDGNCHLCWGKMFFTNYVRPGARGAWEVEHSRARALGGSEHGSNLYGAHIACNRTKGSATSRTARRWNGQTRAPLSTKAKKAARTRNGFVGTGVGAVLGGALAGPPGAWLGAGIGSVIGSALRVK